MSFLIIGSGTIQLGEKNQEHSYKCVKIFNVKKQKKTETDSSLCCPLKGQEAIGHKLKHRELH